MQQFSRVVVGQNLLGKIRQWQTETRGCGQIALDNSVYSDTAVCTHISSSGLPPLAGKHISCFIAACRDEVCESDVVHFTLVYNGQDYRAVDVKLVGQVVCKGASGQVSKLTQSFGFIRSPGKRRDILFHVDRSTECLKVGDHVTFDVVIVSDKPTARKVEQVRRVCNVKEPTVRTLCKQESLQKADNQPLADEQGGKGSDLLDDSDGDSTVASVTDSPNTDDDKSQIMTSIHSLLKVRKAMLQNNLEVHEVNQKIRALEVEYLALVRRPQAQPVDKPKAQTSDVLKAHPRVDKQGFTTVGGRGKPMKK